MKKGICYGTFSQTMPDEEKFALAKRAGFDGVEIHTLDTAAERDRIREIAQKAGVELPSVMPTGVWEAPLSSADEGQRQAGIERIRLSIDTAKAIGATTVLVVPATVDGKQAYASVYERSLRSLRELAPYAANHGIQLAIENVWNRFLLTPREMAGFIEAIGEPNVGLYFDCGNILQYGYPELWIRELGSLLRKVHVKDYDANSRQWRYLLQGTVNWPEVRKALREVGYDDYLTAEMSLYPTYGDQMLFDTSRQMDRIIAGE